MVLPEEERVDVVGAEFFGGNKQKEEFFDPIAEAEAGAARTAEAVYQRFEDEAAFPDVEISSLAKSLQEQINSVLYEDADGNSERTYSYSSSMNWDSPLNKNKSRFPLAELAKALSFYRRCDVAIIGGERDQNNQICLFWIISVAWPTFWEPRVVLTGSSTLQVDGSTIVGQQDNLDCKDLVGTVTSQVVPRFWDVYHIGMSPSAEVLTPIKESSMVYRVPPRLVLQPAMMDSGDRLDNNAAVLPNHAFSCAIKTMGPATQRYVPASPTEVRILPGLRRLEWAIPIAVEYLTKTSLAVPQPDEEDDDDGDAIGCQYAFEPERFVATMSHGGGPQDEDVANVRKQLYDRVLKDGWKPKMVDGRPSFFFWQGPVKACYTTEGGLGMAIYEWRPAFAKSNQVGIELEPPK